MNGIGIFMTLVLLMAAPCSCRSRPAGPAADAESGKEVSAKIEDAVSAEEPAAEPAPGESKQRCLMDFLHVEAKRRGLERALEPVYVEARHQGMLIDIVDLVTARAEEGRYAGVESEIENMAKGVVFEQDLSAIMSIVKSRLTAYGSCMSVASRDDAPCSSLRSAWEDGGLDCYMVYAIYKLMVRDVLIGGKSCEEALAGFKQFKKEDNLALCEALLQQKPELCPWEDLSRENVMCQVAASRARLDVCKKGAFEDPGRDVFCCELFGWRLSSVVSGTADPYVIPEAGALSGDKEGCMRSLTWGLIGDMASMFGYEPSEKEEAPVTDKTGNYLCILEIHWSTLEVP